MKFVNLFLFTILFSNCFTQQSEKDTLIIKKQLIITNSLSIPKIDGDFNDEAWKGVTTISDFTQAFPKFNTPASQKTEVRIIYDNSAIYIAAKLYDTHPDSIARQLGSRDDNLNADKFRIVFDTYNKQQDAFDFTVTASGVQLDSRFSDGSFNAVWESKVKITEEGWNVEMRIPYSAIRFPVTDNHIWGIQITRSINRNGEFIQWALTPRAVNNPIKYWGDLTGIHHIKAPIRLSLTPFVTSYISHYPTNLAGESNYTQKVVGGMDLKYGLNESYTLDMSLLPDFTQVQSDNLVKNLGALEQQYEERRPFFQENNDLFNKGGLFYSRRIGGRPSNYYNIYDSIKEGEKIIINPSNSKMLNISKISGRSEKGLGIGVLNAVVDNTYATLQDSTGNTRKILTEPLSNYNIITLDKQLKNSSNIYLINTNVYRTKGYTIANVTGVGGVLNNKKNTYSLSSNASFTNVLSKPTVDSNYINKSGFNWSIGGGKSSGKFTFYTGTQMVNATYDNNNIGITRQRNYILSELNLNYNQYEPRKNYQNAGTNLNFFHEMNFTTHTLNQVGASTNSYITFKNYSNVNFTFHTSPLGEVDYYEPRTAGRYFKRTKNFFTNFDFNSDYRKKIIFSGYIWAGSTGLISKSIGYNPFFGIGSGSQFRISDKLTLKLNFQYSQDNKDRGFVANDTNGDIIFGVRYLTNVSYDVTLRYMFKNNLSLSLFTRHYWVRGRYVSYHNLSMDGLLLDDTKYNENHSFNYNTINLNLAFDWQFAPGSFVSLAWKNNINSDGSELINNYRKNLSETLSASQLNTISLKVIYYFDFLYLRKFKQKKI
ncbi:MAG: carbohydrate binding family 9 domain-containing protein [Flavobacteriia bacterium]|nr:carbohydrate binding family 9 domain-containing protein [Flavobacteriia bacterium]